MLSSHFQAVVEKAFSVLANKVPQVNPKSNGYWAGFLVGLSLGLIWTPCVGPILASVITLALTGTVTFNAFLITFFYALGTAIPMFTVMVGGSKVLTRIPLLAKNASKIQKSFGILTIFIAIAIFKNWDRNFQSFVLTKFPNYGASLTRIEERGNLSVLTGVSEQDKKSSQDLPVIKKAPDIIAGGQWLNTQAPLSLSGNLKDKVVLVDFWTYTCINCIRTLPYLKNWHQKYQKDGLVIVGVHSPEFEFEKDLENLSKAVVDFDIRYPVVQDNNFATWRAYKNSYWPAKYLIDGQGNLRYYHFGEGSYDETESAIQELLKEIGASPSSQINNVKSQNFSQTPEIYLGFGRGDIGYATKKETYQKQTAPKNIGKNQVAYNGNWLFSQEFAQSDTASELLLNFSAKDIFLVMHPVSGSAEVEIYLDDIFEKKITVNQNKLYEILKLQEPGRHTLKLKFPDKKIKLFAFTFG
ncbi:hypothetical protein A2572_01040 [Candidatus Collierbacteria bacterium RIFOXYD1_FULL_40_9]|uniref:Thioredoxin domain-containing protein n=1 Tax=Candidatus Collierbacteria bacterium RIFOXYD1_FULL_40_9 TaxID=1817731 RepID=A0A1F5FTT5_9BACT|nr:MAG: hypothetical protein A2572_01040 [Candidatus Collierbacteria bacterium RIFOXYD1_FULL_40_9]